MNSAAALMSCPAPARRGRGRLPESGPNVTAGRHRFLTRARVAVDGAAYDNITRRGADDDHGINE